MKITPYDHAHYKDFLNAWIAAQPHRGHGSKSLMARAAQCQTAYISQVVLGSAHLSLEQAERLSELFQLSGEETEYFLLLIQKDRAGTERLQRLFRNRILRIQQHRAQLKNRVDAKLEIDLECQATYFSSWIFPAVHLLAGIPQFQSREAIAKRLQLPATVIDETLDFLETAGLVERNKGRFQVGKARMHLPHDSPLVRKHHMNWRLRAMQDLEKNPETSLHYSSCVSISKKDAATLRENLVRTIEIAKKLVKSSPEEELYCFCVDFFDA